MYRNNFISTQGEGINVLWKPATEEFKVIPPSPAQSATPYRVPYILLHGFGYDRVRDDYKVIRYVSFFHLDAKGLHNLGVPWEDVSWIDISLDPLWGIYSLRSNSWRKLDVELPYSLTDVAGYQVYMDGMCHWWGNCESETEECLVSFDMSNEVFFTTPAPSDTDDIKAFNSPDGPPYMDRYLVVLNGSIAYISYCSETTTFHVSILGEFGVKESWTKLFIVGPLPCISRSIGMGKKGDIFFVKEDDELVWLDLGNQTIKELGVKGCTSYCQIVMYKESFLPIERINN